jgi:hypothetical protein
MNFFRKDAYCAALASVFKSYSLMAWRTFIVITQNGTTT